MKKTAAITLLHDVETRPIPAIRVGPTIGLLARILREYLEGKLD